MLKVELNAEPHLMLLYKKDASLLVASGMVVVIY